MAAGIVLAGCGTTGAHQSASRPTSTTATPPAPSSSTTPATAPCLPSDQWITHWTLLQRAAQVITVPSLDFDIGQLAPLLADGAGGVLFLGSADAPSGLGARIAAAQSSAAPVRALVMADQEGGGVERLAGVVESIPWPRRLAATDSPAQVEQLADRVGTEMARAGVDMDLAPVLDVDGGSGPDASNPDGMRSFSPATATASTYGAAFISGLRHAGVVAVGKHFPGLGSSHANTDYGRADTIPLDQLRTRALPVFSAAIAAGVPAIMIANAAVPGLTSQPASLSAPVITGLLDGQLGFTGLVVTDSLSAGAITQSGFTVESAAVQAIRAGADLVLFGSTLTAAEVRKLAPAEVGATFRSVQQAVVAAVAGGSLPEARLDAAVLAVLKAKGVTTSCGR